MKTLFLVLFSVSLFAQTAPIKFGATLLQGATSIRCALTDVSQFGGLFAIEKPGITCMLLSLNPDTDGFMVAIQARDSSGQVHTYTDKTAANRAGYASPIVFTTDDQELLSVVAVATTGQKVLEAGRFDAATPEAADAIDPLDGDVAVDAEP